jgi:hypothetical protein
MLLVAMPSIEFASGIWTLLATKGMLAPFGNPI